MAGTLKSETNELLIVATKNGTVLGKLSDALGILATMCGGQLPPALIVDDEADQASLDTKTSKRATDPSVEPGRVNSLIQQIRARFPINHTYLQVTATPQALFLQDTKNLFRPQFTILIEPGKGYIGGNTFFSLLEGRTQELIRPVDQRQINAMLAPNAVINRDSLSLIPDSLKSSMCTFFIGATIKYLQSVISISRGGR